MITITVLGVPVAKGRPRFVRATGTAITPEKTRHFEALLRHEAAVVMDGNPPLEGPLVLIVETVVPVPASWSAKRRKAAEAGSIRPTSKPDWENYAKVVDALNMVVWRDDSQIVDGRAVKFYGARPGFWARVWTLEEAEAAGLVWKQTTTEAQG